MVKWSKLHSLLDGVDGWMEVVRLIQGHYRVHNPRNEYSSTSTLYTMAFNAAQSAFSLSASPR